MNSEGICKISLKSQTGHATKFAWKCVSYDRYDTNGTQSDQWEGNTIIARNNVKISGFVFDDVVHLRNVSGCFFDGDYIFEITGDTQGCLCCHIDPCTSRNIIQYDG